MKASKELLQKRLYKRNQVLNANSPFVITDEILEHHYHAFQEPWGEGEKVILQKGDIMQYSKEESKAIWNQNAEFWDCAMGDESNDFHREVVRPKVTELLNPDPTDYILDIACGNGNYSAYLAGKKLSLFWLLIIVRKWWNWRKKRQKRYADHIEFCVADATNETSLMAFKKEISRLQKQSPIWRSWILPILSCFLPLFINCLRITEYLYLRHSTPVL